MPSQQVKYRLISRELGAYDLKSDPLGWESDQRTLERDAENESFFRRYSDSLEFTSDGAAYLKTLVDLYGSNTSVVCERLEENPLSGLFEPVYSENLDLSEYENTDGTVKLPFLSGGLVSLIESNFKESFELDRITDINNNPISNLEYETLGNTGRNIFNESLLRNIEEFSFNAEFEPTLGLRTTEFINDHNIEYQSDTLVNEVFGSFERDVQNSGQWTIIDGQYFYGPSDRNKTLQISIKGNPDILFRTTGNRFSKQTIVIGKPSGSPGVYNASFDNDIVIDDKQGINSGYHPYQSKISVDLQQGEVISLITSVSAGANASTSYTEYESVSEDSDGNPIPIFERSKGVHILIEEDSDYPSTTAKCLTYFNAIKRVLEIITGRTNILESDFFQNTVYKDLLFTSGKMLRELPDGKIITSLEQLLSIKSILYLGYGVENINGRQIFRVEQLSRYFSSRVTMRLKGKFNPKVSIAKDFVIKSIEVGNENAGNYEEQQGLFEYNVKNVYQTTNTIASEKLDLTTTVRLDGIGMEQARRKNRRNFPTEDTPYDFENWALHCIKTQNGIYRLRYWQDDFEEEPTEVYDPPSAMNLLLTPLRALERWGEYIGSSLTRNPNGLISFSSSTGVATMKTKLPNQPVRAENGSYKNGELKRAKFTDYFLDFDFPNNYSFRKQVSGFHERNGVKIPNYMGLLEFTNEDDELQYGYIIKLIENDLASVRLIKANR